MANTFTPLAAGDLRHLVTFQTESTTQDAAGQPVSTWNNVLTTRAAIRQMSARELAQSQLITSQSTQEVTIRWTPTAIMTGMRIIFGTHTFSVQDVNDVDQRHRIYRIQCLEIDGTD
jgi:SPP1 family predicted phage head-tail adaptor